MSLELMYAETPETQEQDPLTEGIDTSNQTVTYIGNTPVGENQIPNPLFVGLDGGSVRNYPISTVWTYPYVIVITLKYKSLDIQTYQQLFNPVIDLNVAFPFAVKCLNYERVSTSILNNKYFYYRANIVEDKLLKRFFPAESFNTTEIIITMVDMPATNLQNIFVPINSLDKVLETVNLYKRYNKYFDENLERLITSIPSNNYWGNKKHCNINITELFTLRDFQSKKDSKFIMICKPNDPFAVANPDGDTAIYPQRIKNKDKYCDIGVSIKKNRKGFFATIADKDYKQIVTNIFKQMGDSQKYKYLLANHLLISKDYPNTVINNPEVLDMIQPLIAKYPGAFKYSIGYAWINLYLEETLYNTKSNKKHRHVFDINTASKLPVFPFTMNDIKQNPYMTLLLDDKQINPDGNCMPLNVIKNYDGYGIATLPEFHRRLNIFITGDPEQDIFKGLDWNKFALSGSIIPACLPKKSPFIDAIMKQTNCNEDQAFKQVVIKYYKSSDIDIMCNDKSFFKFLDSGVDVFNIIKINTNSDDTNSSIEPIKSVAISVTKQFFTDTLQDFNTKNNLTWTLQEYIDNMNDDRIKQYLYNIYVGTKVHIINNFQDNTNVLHQEYAKIIPFDRLTLYYVEYDLDSIKYLRETEWVLCRNNFLTNNKVSDKENNRVIKFSENYRFKFKFNKIGREIEYFKIGSEDFFDVVARFHLPCVRAYYQGNNVYMLPSCITAMMTGINIEYKYFAGIRNPVEIINKYMQRGFGIILNTEELRQFQEFNSKLPEDNLFKLTNNTDTSLFGVRNINHKSFQGFTTDYDYLTDTDMDNYYNKDIVNPLKFKTINAQGNINLCNKSFFELYYNS